MAQSLAKIYVHLVFRTKNGFPFISDKIENELFAYIGGIIKISKGIPFLINGTKDHIHILSSLPKTMALSKFIEEIKRNSSRWIKTKGVEFSKFGWQNGYGAFSVSSSKKDVVVKYISNQKEHHKKMSFKEEYLSFLKEYELNYDEMYLWN